MKCVYCDRCGTELKVVYRAPGIGLLVGYEEVCETCRTVLRHATERFKGQFEAALSAGKEINLLGE